MKENRKTRIMLLIGYCVPFAYIAVVGDKVFRNLWPYVFMIVGLVLLCRAAMKTNNTPVVFIGNIITFASSLLTAKLTELEPMAHYYKPLTSHLWIVVLSVISVLFHILAVILSKPIKRE